MKQTYDHHLEFQVRDYECDLQGIVNNSVYQNYLEHARHEFLKTIGLNFSNLYNRGVVAVVARAELSFKTPLKSGDSFVVKTLIKDEGIKLLFYQDIFRLPDQKICLKAVITSASIINGRLSISEEIQTAFNKVINNRNRW